MAEVTQAVLDYARMAFRNEVEGLLDDPSDLLHPDREMEPAEYLLDRRRFAVQLGLDFDGMVETLGTSYERLRLRQIEGGAIKPHDYPATRKAT